MTTIYLSSTYEDLKEYRRVVFDALRKSGYQVIAMEDYVATDRRPVDKCLQDVSKADVYVGVYGFRYGYVPPAAHSNSNGLSVTELEFRHAEKLKKPCLTFVAKEEAGIPLAMVDAYTGNGEKGEKIKRFREYLLTEKLASPFSSPHELAALVLSAVKKHEDENNKPEKGDRPKTEKIPPATWEVEKHGSPYPGLMHFARKYAPVFFGREAEVREILDRLRSPEGRFLIISGGSGTGKSSLVDAGVLPKIEENGIGEERNIVCVRMVPSQGSHPFDALMRPLHPYAERAGLNVYESAEKTAAQPDTLPGILQQIIAKGMNSDGLVLFLDQMEELFTAQEAGVSNRFLTALYDASQKVSLRVVATIRSDHLHYLHDRPEMRRILDSKGHYPLGPVEPFMLSDMLVKPAECAGLRISESLVRRIVHDTGTEPGNLPLLAFVLNQLFEKRTDRELSETVYKDMGGVNGAIAQHAATVEAKIPKEIGGKKASDLLPRVFASLVIVKEEGLPTRKRPLVSEFSELRGLVDLLVQERLLHTEGAGKEATVSLSHEKLFDAWPALRVFIESNRKALIDQSLLESRARKWEEMGKPWFSGLASRREYRDFQRRGTPEGRLKQYVRASNRAWWLRTAGATVLAVFLLLIVQAWQKGLSVEHTLLAWRSMFTGIHLEPEMEPIEAGVFDMGDVSGDGDSDERPVHEVKIQKPFKLGKYEVTFEEYDRFAIAEGKPLPNDQGWGRGRRPVINVSWNDAKDYAQWLSDMTKKRYRLPTEAEWEYAARSGGKKEIWAGTSDEKELADYAVFRKPKTEPVGEPRKANALGLYDMSGNVWEWVEDCWHSSYQGAPTDGSAWLEEGRGDCGQRVIRGGSWDTNPNNLRTSYRNRYNPDDRNTASAFALPRTFRNPLLFVLLLFAAAKPPRFF